MKRIVIAIMMFLPLTAMAQNNTWEQAETNDKGVVVNPDQKYLVGAVPVVPDVTTHPLPSPAAPSTANPLI